MAVKGELTYEQSKLIDKCYEQYMLGKVQQNEFHVTEKNTIMIFVDPLCADPIPCIEYGFDEVGARYVSFDNTKSNMCLPLHYDLMFDNADRKEELNRLYENKLVLYRPIYRNQGGKLLKNCYIEELLDNPGTGIFFDMIPNLDVEPAIFEKKLKSGDFFDIFNYHGKINYEPSLLLVGNYIYRLIDPVNDEKMLEYSPVNPERWRCVNYDRIVKIHLSDEQLDTQIIHLDLDYCFIDDELRNELLLTENYLTLEEDKTILEEVILEATEELLYEDEEEILYDGHEASFLEAISKKTLNDGLHYAFNDLVNFHTSIKTNPLTILAGQSGTGKTQLALSYASMLGLSEDNHTLLFMPVSPSYNEPSDVLGYYNALNESYVPSDTGLVDFLVEAGKEPENIYMVVFDEMNLAQVEHWFSPFISILEKNVDDRYLTLYDGNVPCKNENEYPSRIKVGENIIFVGTVNIDDTTKEFSDRLLDRAFMIELHKLSFKEYFEAHKGIKKKGLEIPSIDYTMSEFMSWIHNDQKNYINSYEEHYEELEFLDDLDHLIEEHIVSGGISYRVLKNISNYMNNIPYLKNGEMIIDRKVAFDLVIDQSVMTKIRGTESKLNKLIGYYEGGKVVNSSLLALLDQYASISDFKEVRNTILQKAKELMIDGYTN